MSTFQTLPGFRDFYPQDCAIRNYIFDRFRSTAQTFGFEEYDAPVLEPTELFTTKSGEEIVAQLFNFEDKGGRKVALRPEITPSLARMIGNQEKSMRRPIKWFNISEAFRYERQQKGRLRSFFQMNADLFGDISFAADAELIALVIQALKSFGLTHKDFHVRLSDRKLWTFFIAAHGISDAGQVLEIIDKIEREAPDQIIKKLNIILGAYGKTFFSKIMDLKCIHQIGDLRLFFENIEACGHNIDHTEIDRRLQELENLHGRISDFGLSDFVTIDFGIVRGLAYYTGYVFEVFERSGSSRALAGGGRYDDLIKKLGYSDLPAVGFAIGDVTLGNILKEKKLLPKISKSIDCFVVFSEGTESMAMKSIIELRSSGYNVEYCLNRIGFSKQLSASSSHHSKFSVIFGNDEVARGLVKIKNMITGEEKFIKIENIKKIIQQ